jgi:ribosomal-protein-alanine N-acetyltransferase
MAETQSALRCLPLDAALAAAIVDWRYPAPYDVYDPAVADPELPHRDGAAAGDRFAILSERGGLLAYFRVGAAARVRGGRYDGAALDLGLGLHPALVRRGLGLRCLRAALDCIAARWPGRSVRATIGHWNIDALRVAKRAGFEPVGSFGGFRRGAPGRYVVLLRE